MIDTKEKPVERVTERPAPMWRNRWRVLVAFYYAAGKPDLRYPGEEYDGEYLHPSKDVAETVAAASLASWQPERAPYEYVGAFPVTP